MSPTIVFVSTTYYSSRVLRPPPISWSCYQTAAVIFCQDSNFPTRRYPLIATSRSPQARREQGLEPFHAQDDVFHGARILVNTAFGVEYPHSVAPLIEMTGPLLPPRIARALSPRPPCPSFGMPPGTRQHAGSATFRGATERSSVESPSAGRPEVEGGGVDGGDPLALPFLIRTWLGGTGDLVAPGTAAFEAVAKQAASARLRAEASAEKEDSGTGVGGTTSGSLSLPDDGGVIYVNLGRMPQLDKWQLMTVLQALSSPSEAACWSGGVADDRLGPFRVLWVLPREQREQLLSVLLPTAPPPSFRLKVLGGLPHLAVRAWGRHANLRWPVAGRESFAAIANAVRKRGSYVFGGFVPLHVVPSISVPAGWGHFFWCRLRFLFS